jgi:hypothetical protein
MLLPTDPATQHLPPALHTTVSALSNGRRFQEHPSPGGADTSPAQQMPKLALLALLSGAASRPAGSWVTGTSRLVKPNQLRVHPI